MPANPLELSNTSFCSRTPHTTAVPYHHLQSQHAHRSLKWLLNGPRPLRRPQHLHLHLQSRPRRRTHHFRRRLNSRKQRRRSSPPGHQLHPRRRLRLLSRVGRLHTGRLDRPSFHPDPVLPPYRPRAADDPAPGMRPFVLTETPAGAAADNFGAEPSAIGDEEPQAEEVPATNENPDEVSPAEGVDLEVEVWEPPEESPESPLMVPPPAPPAPAMLELPAPPSAAPPATPLPQLTARPPPPPDPPALPLPRQSPLPPAPYAVSGDVYVRQAPGGQLAYFWDGILPAGGIAIVAGLPRAGKSLLMQALAVAACDGEHSVAGRRVLPSRIVYCYLEHQKAANAENFRKAMTGLEVDSLGHIQVVTSLIIDDDESLASLRSLADEVEAQVIIIDSLRRAYRGDENSSRDAAELIRRLQSLTADGARLVIAIHHPAKGGTTPRGSGDQKLAPTRLFGCPGAAMFARSKWVPTWARTVQTHFTMDFEDNSFSINAIEPENGPVTRDALHQTILDVVGSGQQTLIGIRAGVRTRGFSAASDAIDTAVRLLEEQGRLRNEGTRGRHRWVLVEAASAAEPDELPDEP